MASFEVFIDGIDFGEGPRWHDGRLWYSDFYQHTVNAVSPDGRRETIVTFDDGGQPSGLGWMPDGSLLIVSMLDRTVRRLVDGRLHVHADLSGIAEFHCNDMVVDRRGHAYVGNFGFDLFTLGVGGARPATLAHVRPDGTAAAAAHDLHFPNGSVITPDGGTLIVGETMGARYTAFHLDAGGNLGPGRVWAEVPGMAPDGCTLDEAGGIWFADAVGARVVRVEEGGRITDTLDVGTDVYACALGGADGRTLYVLAAPDADPTRAAGTGRGSILTTRVEHAHAGLP
jgi:sugar lactone lactonase YvrE